MRAVFDDCLKRTCHKLKFVFRSFFRLGDVKFGKFENSAAFGQNQGSSKPSSPTGKFPAGKRFAGAPPVAAKEPMMSRAFYQEILMKEIHSGNLAARIRKIYQIHI